MSEFGYSETYVPFEILLKLTKAVELVKSQARVVYVRTYRYGGLREIGVVRRIETINGFEPHESANALDLVVAIEFSHETDPNSYPPGESETRTFGLRDISVMIDDGTLSLAD